MATKSVDTFAHTNPAFCALVLRAFVEGYQKSDARGVLLTNEPSKGRHFIAIGPYHTIPINSQINGGNWIARGQ